MKSIEQTHWEVAGTTSMRQLRGYSVGLPTILHRRGLGTMPFTMFLPPGYAAGTTPRPVWGTGAPSQNLVICEWLLVDKFVLWNVQLQLFFAFNHLDPFRSIEQISFR